MDAIIPRYHLPETWSGIGTCPICRLPGQLRVEHENVLPDRMLCKACGTAFEVESDGAHIRLAVVPAVLLPNAPSLVDIWRLPAEVSDLVEQALGSAGVPVAATPAPQTAPLGAGVAFAAETAAGAVIATGVAPNGSTLQAADNARAPAPDLGNTQPNPALRRAATHGATLDAGAASSSAAGTPHTPAPARPEAAAFALHAALAEALQALPASAPRSDAMLADELAAALNVARRNVAAPPASSPQAITKPAKPQPARTNGAAAEALAAAVLASAPVIEPGPAQSAIVAIPAAIAAQATAAPATIGTSAPVDPARAAEFGVQATRLREYGNSLQLIQAALERSGASPQEARQAMANVLAVDQARQASFRGTLQWVAGISITVMVLLLAAAIGISLAQRQPASGATPASGTPAGVLVPAVAATATAGQAVPTPTMTFNPIVEFLNSLFPGNVKIANGPSPTPGPTSAVLSAIFPPTATLDPAARATLDAAKSGLPAWVSTLVPNSLTVLNVPTPSLETTGPPAAACPVTPDNAAILFGGKANYWSYDRTNAGWVMIVAGSPITMRLPANMTAGYLVIGAALEMRSAQGPATIHNVNFAAVNCRA